MSDKVYSRQKKYLDDGGEIYKQNYILTRTNVRFMITLVMKKAQCLATLDFQM